MYFLHLIGRRKSLFIFGICSVFVVLGSLAILLTTRAAGPYHVRTDGSDTTCNGLSNASVSSAPNCAFATPQKAVDAIVPGEDIVIHAGTYPAFQIWGSAGATSGHAAQTFQASAANPTVIEGDPGVASSSVVIDAGANQAGIWSWGGSGGSSRTQFITIRHMRVTGGTHAAILFGGPEGTSGNNQHSDLVVEDVYFNGFSQMARSGGFPPDAVILVAPITGGILGSSRFENLTMIGDATRCEIASYQNTCGSNTSAFSISIGASVVRNVYAEHIMGSFIYQGGPDNIYEYNTLKNVWCDEDDACFQDYNISNITVRYNTVINSTPIDDTFGIVKIRRTNPSTGQPSLKVYNNTFIGATNCSVASPCPTDSVGDNRSRIAFEIGTPDSAAVYGPVVVENNLFIGYGSVRSPAAVSLYYCPSSLTITNNLYFNNSKDLINSAGCAGSIETPQIADPQLNPTTYTPPIGSPACSGGDSTVDGGQGASYRGAKPCVGAPGQPVPIVSTKTVNTSSTGAVLALSGSATDSNGTIQNLDWSLAPSVGCAITNQTRAGIGTANATNNATVTCSADGIYTATLTARDNNNQTGTDTGTITRDTVAPGIPGGVAGVLSNGQPQISWNASTDPSPGVGGITYTAQRSTSSGGPYSALGTVSASPFTDVSALGGTTYYYKVFARDSFFNASADSAAVSVTTLQGVALQDGLNGYAGTADNTIKKDAGAAVSSCVLGTDNDQCWNRGGYSQLVAGAAVANVLNRSLVRFDIQRGTGQNEVPTGVAVTGATLTLTCVGGTNASPQTIRAYRALKPWVEGAGDNGVLTFSQSQSPNSASQFGSSWVTWTGTTNWGASGASSASDSGTHNTGSGSGFDRRTTADASQSVSTCTNTPYTWDVTASVREWIENGVTNDGFVVAMDGASEGSAGSQKLFASSEHATQGFRPRLSIAWGGGGGGGSCGSAPASGSPEGFGSATTGGAGQPIICVRSLADSGADTLRAALNNVGAGGARIYFDVGGTINLAAGKLSLSGKNNVTIDGSTAPAPGITINGSGNSVASNVPQFELRGSSNVIVRHIRVRNLTGPPVESVPGIQVYCGAQAGTSACGNIWIDHVSLSQHSDDSVVVYGSVSDVTVSNSIVYDAKGITDPSPEAMNISGPGTGDIPDRVTAHHNVLTKNFERNPSILGDTTGGTLNKPTFDFRNNIVHAWGNGGFGTRLRYQARGNVVKNVYQSTVSQSQSLWMDTGVGAVYVSGNEAPQVNINSIGTAVSPVGSAPAIAEHTTAELRLPLGCNPLLDVVGAMPRDAIDTAAVNAVIADIGAGSCAPDTQPPTAPTNLGVTGVSQINGSPAQRIAQSPLNLLALVATAFRSFVQAAIVFFIQLGF